MILPNQEVSVPRPPEREVIYEIATKEDGEHQFLELGRRFGCIRDHMYVVKTSGGVQQRYEEWNHLKEILREVYAGKVYRCRHNVEGGRDARGGKGGRGARGMCMLFEYFG